MSKKVSSKRHFSIDSRSRLIRLRDEVMWLLDEDERFGFDEENISYRLGPSLMSVLSLVWFKPLRTVSRPFRPIYDLDLPRVYVRKDIYDGLNNRVCSLSAENMVLREKLGLKDDDEILPF